MPELPFNINIDQIIELLSAPSFKTIQLAIIIYFGLLWLAIIIWVTRDAINRSQSILFQVTAILLNIIFPILGILLYLIIRPGKTTMERYYEELEHRLILESITEKERGMKVKTIKKLPKKSHKPASKK